MGITVSKELQAALDSKGLTLTGSYFINRVDGIVFGVNNGQCAKNNGFISTELPYRREVVGRSVFQTGVFLSPRQTALLLKKHLNN